MVIPALWTLVSNVSPQLNNSQNTSSPRLSFHRLIPVTLLEPKDNCPQHMVNLFKRCGVDQRVMYLPVFSKELSVNFSLCSSDTSNMIQENLFLTYLMVSIKILIESKWSHMSKLRTMMEDQIMYYLNKAGMVSFNEINQRLLIYYLVNTNPNSTARNVITNLLHLILSWCILSLFLKVTKRLWRSFWWKITLIQSSSMLLLKNLQAWHFKLLLTNFHKSIKSIIGCLSVDLLTTHVKCLTTTKKLTKLERNTNTNIFCLDHYFLNKM